MAPVDAVICAVFLVIKTQLVLAVSLPYFGRPVDWYALISGGIDIVLIVILLNQVFGISATPVEVYAPAPPTAAPVAVYIAAPAPTPIVPPAAPTVATVAEKHTYDRAAKELADEQGEFYVAYLLEAELTRLYKFYATGNHEKDEYASESEEEDSDSEATDEGGSDSEEEDTEEEDSEGEDTEEEDTEGEGTGEEEPKKGYLDILTEEDLSRI